MSEDLSSYNNALVDKATIFFSKGLLESFKKLDVESKGKAGRPPHPNSLIILLPAMRAYFKPPYRRQRGRLRWCLAGWESPKNPSGTQEGISLLSTMYLKEEG